MAANVHATEALLFHTLLQLAVIVLAARAGGVIAISCAAINDVVGWMMLALVSALSVSAFAPGPFVWRSLAIAALVALAWWVVRPPLTHLVQRALRSRGDAAALPPTLMGVILACVFAAGMTTYQLGIFTLTGLRTNIGSLHDGRAWGWCVLLIALATCAKLGECTVAARRAGLDPVRARILGMLMNTRGLMELVVINVGLEMGMIGPQVFTMLVLMALASTVVTSPALRRWLPRTQAQADVSRSAALGGRG